MAAPADARPQATVFYSWQSDLPNSTNRGLILDALERAAKSIRVDGSIAVEPVVDRDTLNVPGAPDISHTILQKIEKATAFVADVSVINPGVGRPTPNPNVLVELGYALKALGNRRTILVTNTANGPVESLPFDLRTKRVLSYHVPPGTAEKSQQRKKLQEGLEAALRAILIDAPLLDVVASPSITDKAIESIEKDAPNKQSNCEKVMTWIADQVNELTPKLVHEKSNEWPEQLVAAIQKTLPLVEDFARVVRTIAEYDSVDAARGLFRGFAALFSQYTLPPSFAGMFFDVQFDFPKFVGHELMVTLFAAMLREQRWNTIGALCREAVALPAATRRLVGEPLVTYRYASSHVALLDDRSRAPTRACIPSHAGMLKQRHESGRLAEDSPWRTFQEGDLFLYLRSSFERAKFSLWEVWLPWSAAILGSSPGFLLEATHAEKAKKLLEPLGIASIEDLRSRLKEPIAGLRQLFGSRNPFYIPFEGLNPDNIGTR